VLPHARNEIAIFSSSVRIEPVPDSLFTVVSTINAKTSHFF
jgi:hypothetical protein